MQKNEFAIVVELGSWPQYTFAFMALGKWALLDIETTGIDPSLDDIIDIGFLCFEGTKLTKKFSSLVRTDLKISPFITHLTGITQKMVDKAPVWDQIKNELHDLDEHYIIAHNAAFESSFLGPHFDELVIKPTNSELDRPFGDSIPFLAAMHPGRSSLNLESFIVNYGVADSEVHRGFEDAQDTLKVMLRTCWELQKDKIRLEYIQDQFKNFSEYWFNEFINLSKDELKEIAEQIDFNIEDYELNKNITIPNDTPLDFNAEFSAESLKAVFQDESLWKTFIPKYQYRKQQEEMALKVGQSFKNGIHSLVQAPTGTGKSFAYLIPALSFAKQEKKRVLVTTGTKVLQNQLLEKDLPKALSLLGLNEHNCKVTKLIGTQNHLCQAKFEHSKNEQSSLFADLDFFEKFSQVYFDILFFDNSRRPYNEMLTRENLPYALKRMIPDFDQASQDLAVDFKSCLGHKCPHVSDCSYFIGLDEAKKSQVVIGNHALTFLWPQSIERPEYIVFDEAHKVEETATSAFSLITGFKKLESFLKPEGGTSGIGALFYLMGLEDDETVSELRRELIIKQQDARNHLNGLEMIVGKMAHNLDRYSSEYWNEIPYFKSQQSTLEVSFSNELVALRDALLDIKWKLAPQYEKFEGKEWEEQNGLSAWTYFRSYYNQLEEYEVAMTIFLNEDEEYCRSVRFHESYGCELSSIPIDIGRIVHQKLLEPTNSVVFTSATLGNMKGDRGTINIEWLTGYLYTEPAKRFKKGLYLDPVFDYEKQAKVYFSDDLPPIYRGEYVDHVVGKLLPVIEAIQGKTLLLFSSYKRFERAREICLEKLQGKLEIFYQGMGANVVEDFKNSKRAVLLGLESFGEGIDIPGESLQLLYIDKVPDLGMELIFDQRKKFFDRNFGNSFSEYFMATRARKLQQKLGRLIRSTEDNGVIIVTDSRMNRWKSRTFDEFSKLLEPYRVQRLPFEEAIEHSQEYFQ